MQIRVKLSLCSVKQYVIKTSKVMLHKSCRYMVMVIYTRLSLDLRERSLLGPYPV